MTPQERFQKSQFGLVCPNCHETESIVAETRPWNGALIRVRKCKHCNTRSYTLEASSQFAFQQYQDYNAAWNQSRQSRRKELSALPPTEAAKTPGGLLKHFGKGKIDG